jgi:hypothetical protein
MRTEYSAYQACEDVRNTVTLLRIVGSEIWVVIMPSQVDLAHVCYASYRAVPSQYLALDEFRTTSNDKVDKRELFAMVKHGLQSSTGPWDTQI